MGPVVVVDLFLEDVGRFVLVDLVRCQVEASFLRSARVEGHETIHSSQSDALKVREERRGVM